jgi:hypothetical protein
MTDGTEPHHDARLPGVTVQRTAPVVDLQAQLIGALGIDPSTNCLVLVAGVNFSDAQLDIAWPPGWTVSIRDGKPALIDATGHTAAELGDEISVGGGFVATTVADVTSCTGRDYVFVASGLSRL